MSVAWVWARPLQLRGFTKHPRNNLGLTRVRKITMVRLGAVDEFPLMMILCYAGFGWHWFGMLWFVVGVVAG